MLQHLRIRNLALLDEVTLEFGRGFIAVTGETGAGKSVLLGALDLLAGGRADKTLIRSGAEECEVEAVLFFADSKEVDAVLAELGLPGCEEGSFVISRTLSRSKAAKVRINGQLATLGNLQRLGACWIDFHGPGEPQKLLHERHQLLLLDSFARNERERAAYAQQYRAWMRCGEEMQALRHSARLSPEEADFLRSQIEAIDQLAPSEERMEALEQDYRRLVNGQEIREKGAAVYALFQGDEGAIERVSAALHLAREVAALDASAETLADRIESLLLELEDLGQEFGSRAELAELDEEAAAEVQSLMEQWLTLRRKYGGSLESVLERRSEMAARLASQGDVEGNLARLEAERDRVEEQMRVAAEALRETRVKASRLLAKDAGALLAHLGFRKARFGIEIQRESEWREHGGSRCQFLFTPNPGVEPLPLGKVASSGEIARVMLALKAVLARVDATPVLVFDEVDANVGGEIAAVVGRELASLGDQGHQVFCVTHLPQVAATATAHYLVSKEQGKTHTAVSIKPIHGQRRARLEEISRMLGDRNSVSARRHAEELLLGT